MFKTKNNEPQENNIIQTIQYRDKRNPLTMLKNKLLRRSRARAVLAKWWGAFKILVYGFPVQQHANRPWRVL